jgi:hypothetical protein
MEMLPVLVSLTKQAEWHPVGSALVMQPRHGVGCPRFGNTHVVRGEFAGCLLTLLLHRCRSLEPWN